MTTFIHRFFAPARKDQKNAIRTAIFGLLIAGAFLMGGSMFGGGSMVPTAHAWYCSPGTGCSTLTTIVNVVNTGGGTKTPSDFQVTLTDESSGTYYGNTAVFAGSASGTVKNIDPEQYTVVAGSQTNYSASYSSACNGSIAAGESKTCTITETYSSGGTSTCSVATALADNVSDLTPQVGETITYTLTGNYSFTASTTITVNDALGTGLTFVSASTSAGSYASSTGVWNVGTLNGGSTITLILKAKVNAGTEGKTIDNKPSVHYVQSGCTETSAVTGVQITVQNATVIPQNADISVNKTADVTSTTEGSTINYTIAVKDLGPVTSTDVMATDTLPSSLTFVSASTSAGSYASSTGTWTIGTLSAGSTATLQIAALVKTGTASSTITNTATVTESSSETDLNLSNNSSSVVVAVVGASSTPSATINFVGIEDHNTTATIEKAGDYNDVIFSISSSSPVTVNSQNGSLSSLTSSLVNESGTIYWDNLSQDGAKKNIGYCLLGNGNCTIAGAPYSNVQYYAGASGTQPNAALFSASGPVTVTLLGRFAGYPNVVGWYDPSNPSVLHPIFPSSVTATGTSVTFTPSLVFGLYLNNGTGNTFYSQNAKNVGGGTIQHFALFEAMPSSTATPSADLTIKKIVDNANPSVGNTVHYTVAVKDLGPATSTGVVATDTLPSGLTFVNATASVGTYASSTGTWTIGTLSASSTATLDIAALVKTGTQGDTITNTATVGESTSTVDHNLTNNSSSVSITVQGGGSTPTATIIATKVICGNVGELPDLSGSGATITSSTAAAFLATHPDCHLASGWDFQWGNASATDPGANFIGVTTSTGWMTAFGPTGSNGQATVQIQNPTTYSKFWLREVQQNGYLAFAYPPVNSTDSAEFFCNTDVKNYDNYDQIDSPQNNATYYCVAWNVPTATTTVPSADISITKTVDNANPSVGDTVNYTLTVAALGPATSTGVVASDTLPSGVTFVSATSSEGSYASSTGIWTIGDMSASSTATLKIAATVNSGTAGTTIDNTGTVHESTSTIDNNPGNNSSTVPIVVQGGGGGGNNADIAITKTVDATSTLPGGTLHYTITAIAHGPLASTGVVATDTLPSGLTFVNATTSASTTYNSLTGSWTIGTLLPNATATLQIAATVNATGTAGTIITNQATISESSTLTDTNTGNNLAQATTTVGNASSSNQADLAISKTVDNANPVTGTNVNFTVVVTNNGPATDSMIDGFDQLPAGLATISATTTASTSYNLGTGVWTIGTLAPNATATLTIAAEVSAPAGTVITNTATVSSTLASIIDPNLANNSSSVTLNVQSAGCTSNCGGGGGGGGGNTPSAEIGIVKTVDNADPATGVTIHYTLTVNATGPSASFGVVANDLLPSGVTFVSATSSEGSYNSSTGVWTIGTMNNGTSATLTITATVTAANGTAITNTGTVHESPTVVDPLSGDNSSSVTINVGGGGGGGGGGTVGVGGGGGGQVLGASTSTGQVLGASCGLYLTQYIHPVRKDLNDPTEVKKLQIFLNQNLGLNLPITGYYGNQTIAAVDQFQVKYHTEVLAPWLPLGLPTQFTPTSYVYQTTQRWINLIMCPPLNLPLPALKVDMGGE